MIELEFMRQAEEESRILKVGEIVYDHLLSLRKEGKDYLICPEHIGDTIWICALACDYADTHDCDEVNMVVKDSHKEIAASFPGVSEVIPLSDTEMNCLRRFIIYTGRYNNNHILYAHTHAIYSVGTSGFYTAQMVAEFMSLSMKESRRHILGIPNDHMITLKRMNCLDSGKDKDLHELFCSAVFFIPSMQTQAGVIPDSIYSSLVDRYQRSGYECYTNYNNLGYERMIEGTKPLTCTLKELAVIAPYFAQVISVRSGAADLVAQTEANLSVLYHNIDTKDKEAVIASPAEVGSQTVHDLVCREGIKEYIYVEGREEELAEAVFEQRRTR